MTSFSVGGAEGYMTASSYPDDGLGEIFLKMSKQGSTLAGVMDAFSIAVSIGLQYGVPLETFVSKFVNMRFEPAGMTDDPDVRMAQSMMDYIFRRLALDYLDFDTRAAYGIYTAEERARQLETGSYQADERRRRHRGGARDPRAVGADHRAARSAADGGGRRETAPAQVGSSAELLEACTARRRTRRCACPAAPRCAPPVPATSAKDAAAPAAAAEPRLRPRTRSRSHCLPGCAGSNASVDRCEARRRAAARKTCSRAGR